MLLQAVTSLLKLKKAAFLIPPCLLTPCSGHSVFTSLQINERNTLDWRFYYEQQRWILHFVELGYV